MKNVGKKLREQTGSSTSGSEDNKEISFQGDSDGFESWDENEFLMW